MLSMGRCCTGDVVRGNVVHGGGGGGGVVPPD